VSKLPKELQKLSLIHSGIDEMGALALAGALKSAPELRSLCLTDNILGDTGVVALAVGLAGSRITSLGLRCTGFGLKGMKALAFFLESTTDMQDLDLGGNEYLDDACIAVLANGLCGSKLSFLDISSCSFGARGTEFLASTLSGNRSLTDLQLSENKIGNQGAEHLAKVLRASSLTSLGVNHCQIDSKGFDCLAAGLIDTAITELNIGSKLPAALMAALEANKNRSFVLQMSTERRNEAETFWIFRTIAGNVVATLPYDEELTVDAVTDNVLRQLRASGSLAPAACNLKLLRADGTLLNHHKKRRLD
jgi:Ran GTPase-activating protein (RanGAP) involved in mRNA processing and transport